MNLVQAPPVSRWVRLRLGLCWGGLCACLFLLVGRAFVLQIRQVEQYRTLAEEQYLREVELPAHRGRILDRIGTELAASTEVDSVFANPRLVRAGQPEPPPEVVRALAAALHLDRKEVSRRLRAPGYFTWLKRRVLPEEARAVRELGINGVGLLPEPKRYYPNRSLAGPVLGWAGLDSVGLEGVELAYDRWLRGSRGAIPGLQDARGNKLFVSGIGDLTRDSGHDVYLTLDKFIQFKLEQALEEGVAAARARAGVAVAMDPRTGEILAMASVPSLNPNDPGNARERGVRNRAVTDPFEPGSTIKPFSIAAALEAGVIRVDQEWDCEGGRWKVGNAIIHDAEPEGTLSTTQVLARSSNICTAKITRRLGKEGLYQFLRRMGFAAPTGVDLPGERAGVLRPPGRWGEVGFATISFGQGMTATPIQLVTAMSAFANGGILYRPYIVRRVVDPRGNVVLENRPEGRRVVSAEVAAAMRLMMRAVMQKRGTGEKIDIPGYPVAGKTGTAQKVDPATRRYSPDRWASSFMGFAPYDDARLALFVMVDEPQGSHYGSAVAGPIFVKVMSAALPYLGVAPRPAQAPVAEATPASPRALPERSSVVEQEIPVDDKAALPVAEPAIVPDAVPDFSGLALGEALSLAQQARLRLEIVGSGRTVAQVPPPGSPRRGPVCKLLLAPPD
ncbi:MAG: penicillin-binding transpeptidase domain-containing protein [Myxococcales bacterium]|nr:penicillin-binding transpeptidase domain-containing protein [Myxococcota bacterium]MDW8280521.1 penicillin-binding transpeptidase domain-containing protein [Myxococcales bacterium]